MASKNRATLNSDADTNLEDNTSGDILPEHVRGAAKDLADSCANLNDDIATAAQVRSSTDDKLLTTPNVYAATAPVTLTDAATIAVDMATGIAFTVTLGANRTLGTPTNVEVGKSGILRVVQDGTGSRELALGANWTMADGNAPDLSTDADAKDSFSFFAWTATEIELYPIGKAFS